MEIVTKQGFKIIGILPYELNNDKKTKFQIQVEALEFNNMFSGLKKAYSKSKVLFDRDFENNRIVFFEC
jgi:hypothetical protein